MIKQKFQLSAALNAEHALAAWAATETCWDNAAPLRVGPFEISYGYQRADLWCAVQGPMRCSGGPSGCTGKAGDLYILGHGGSFRIADGARTARWQPDAASGIGEL
jgi:hypothetical protein